MPNEEPAVAAGERIRRETLLLAAIECVPLAKKTIRLGYGTVIGWESDSGGRYVKPAAGVVVCGEI